MAHYQDEDKYSKTLNSPIKKDLKDDSSAIR